MCLRYFDNDMIYLPLRKGETKTQLILTDIEHLNKHENME